MRQMTRQVKVKERYILDLSYNVAASGFLAIWCLMRAYRIYSILPLAFFLKWALGRWLGSLTTTNYTRHRMIQRSSHSLQGLSLLRNCLDELPQDRKATIAGDMGELKRELREKVILLLVLEMMIFMAMRRWKIAWFWKARRESELAKSKMQPNSAHKVTLD